MVTEPTPMRETPEHVWDVIVVGSGMGGSMAAAALAAAGIETLVIESGKSEPAPPEKATLLQKFREKAFAQVRPNPHGERWPEALLFRSSANGRYNAVRPILGHTVGGSAAIYGAALGRARRTDFENDWQPQSWLPSAEAALPNAWPVSFDQMKGYYLRTERLLGVAGTPDPLDPDDDSDLRSPPAISGNTAALVEQLRRNGRHPYRMHVGINYKSGCNECQGQLCGRACKATSFNRALAPALATRQTSLLTQHHVSSIKRLSADLLSVQTIAHDGRLSEHLGRKVILAAGALNTPLLLRRSHSLWPDSAVPALIGGGLMFHFSDMLAVSGANPTPANGGPMKTLAFRDHYLDGGMPMAECQSLGMVASPWMVGQYLEGEIMELGLAKVPLLALSADIVGRAAAGRFSQSYLFTAAVEDLPYAQNRVEALPGPSKMPGFERIGVTYKAPPELILRAKRLRALLSESFAPAKVRFLKRLGAPNLGHPMGTCRMGDDPATSVTDPDGQVWGQPGIYVADASSFPSSLGINPALTVAANALRIAEKITRKESLAPNAPASSAGMRV